MSVFRYGVGCHTNMVSYSRFAEDHVKHTVVSLCLSVSSHAMPSNYFAFQMLQSFVRSKMCQLNLDTHYNKLPYIFLFFLLSICFSLSLSVCLSVSYQCLSVRQSVSLSVHVYVMSVSVSVCGRLRVRVFLHVCVCACFAPEKTEERRGFPSSSWTLAPSCAPGCVGTIVETCPETKHHYGRSRWRFLCWQSETMETCRNRLLRSFVSHLTLSHHQKWTFQQRM